MRMRNTILASGKWRVASSRSANAAIVANAANYGTPTSHSPLATSHTYRSAFHKSAFTLIELLVYMAILGFIIVVAGRVFSDATGMRVRTQNMTRAAEEANRLAELVREDISQMGAKAHPSNPLNPVYSFAQEVYMSSASNDLSSFRLWQREDLPDRNDSIVFRKVSYGSDGSRLAVREITWALGSDSVLRRTCRTSYAPTGYTSASDPESAACPTGTAGATVAMATGVQSFALLPSTPAPVSPFILQGGLALKDYHVMDGNTWYYQTNFTEDGYTAATIGGFIRNDYPYPNPQKAHRVFVGDQDGSNNGWYGCRKFPLYPGGSYAVRFRTPMNYNGSLPDSLMALFQPGLDHMSVGIINGNTGLNIPGLADFMFYPPQYNSANQIDQYFEFSVKEQVDACVAFTFAFYSGGELGPHLGKIKIQSFELLRKSEDAYNFVRSDAECAEKGYETGCYIEKYATEEDPSASPVNLLNKRSAKAFELILKVNRRGETGSASASGGAGGYVIPVPNNGVAL